MSHWWKEYLPDLQHSQWVGFAIALVSSLVLTPLVAERARKLKILDQPGGRHIHDHAVPRLGGIAIFISLLVVSLLFLIFYGRYTPSGTVHFELLGILAGASLIFFVGLLDDLSPLSAWVKLLSQLLASAVAWLCNVKVNYLINPFYYVHLADNRVWELDPILSFAVTVGWLILITNALNLIDGLDGLAGGVTLIVALSLWSILLDDKISQPAGALLSATLAGAVLGFLRSNYNPARIFLGDCGAYFLGFTLGGIAVAGLAGEPNTATVGSVVVIAFSFPIADTLLAIVRRAVKGQSIMQADAEHIHHRILKAGLSAKGTMFTIYGTCGLLGLVACTISGAEKRYATLLLMTLSLALLSILWRRSRDKNNSPSKMSTKTSVE